MGLFDTVKLKAGELAADAERASKVTAAQARTVVLQNDIRKAERELGHSAFSLIESGQIVHPDLEATAARLRQARRGLADKEAEIKALRRGAEAAGEAAASPADGAAGPVREQAETDPPQPTSEEAEPAAAAPTTNEPATAAAPTAKKPAAKRRSPATDDPPAKTSSARRKSSARKASAAQPPSADA